MPGELTYEAKSEMRFKEGKVFTLRRSKKTGVPYFVNFNGIWSSGKYITGTTSGILHNIKCSYTKFTKILYDLGIESPFLRIQDSSEKRSRKDKIKQEIRKRDTKNQVFLENNSLEISEFHPKKHRKSLDVELEIIANSIASLKLMLEPYDETKVVDRKIKKDFEQLRSLELKYELKNILMNERKFISNEQEKIILLSGLQRTKDRDFMFGYFITCVPEGDYYVIKLHTIVKGNESIITQDAGSFIIAKNHGDGKGAALRFIKMLSCAPLALFIFKFLEEREEQGISLPIDLTSGIEGSDIFYAYQCSKNDNPDFHLKADFTLVDEKLAKA